MKYFLVVVLLFTSMVSGEDDDKTNITEELSEFMKKLTEQVQNISKSISNDTTFGDITKFFKTTKVSKRDVNSGNNLSTLKAELKRKCYIFGSPENYPSVEVAIENFDSCINGVASRIQKDKISGKDRSTNVECRYASEVNSCFVTYTDALRPCLPHYKGGYFPFAKISEAVINYLCFEQGAQERTKSFVENGFPCIYSRRSELEECLNSSFPSGSYPKIEENAYLFSEDNCRKLFEFRTCVKAELQNNCSPSVVSFLEGLKNVVEKFYSPCLLDHESRENAV